MLEKSNILVVDDEPMNVELLKAILESNHYDVLTASNGAEALEMLLKEKVDLVLLDVMMPSIDGFEVTRRIRADKRTEGLPVILITALHEMGDRISGIEAGCDEFVTKPFNKGEVLARIKTLLRLNFYRSQNDERGKFEQVVNRMHDGLIVCDADLRMLRSNQKGRELLGSEDQSPGWLELMKKTFKVGYAGDLKTDLGLKNLDFDVERPGATFTQSQILSFSSSVIHDTGGKLASIVIVLHDVTAQRQGQFEKENFLGVMTSQLRAPLVASLGQLSGLAKAVAALPDLAARTAAVDAVGKAAGLLQRIGKVFDFVAVGTSDLYDDDGPKDQAFPLDGVAALAKELVQEDPQQKVECQFDLPGSLEIPVSGASFKVLLKCLIENALRSNDKPVAKLVFAASQNETLVRFVVSDNGPGAPGVPGAQPVDSFYHAFARTEGTAHDGGLGLAIVQKIVESRQGSMRVDHPRGGGTSVTLTLPKLAADAAMPRALAMGGRAR